MTDFAARYLKVCDAVTHRVAADIKVRRFRGRVLVDPEAWGDWVRSRVGASGRYSKDAVAHCQGRHNVREYARMLAVDLLWKTDPAVPWDVDPNYLEGDDLLDYWRLIVIAGELPS